MAEIIFSLVIIGTGVYFLIKFILEILINRIAYVDDILSLLLLPVGVCFMVDGFRKRFYFEVVLDNDKRKFPLGRKPDPEELRKFVRAATQLGYIVDISLFDNRN